MTSVPASSGRGTAREGSAIEETVRSELNRLRTSPASYADLLRARSSCYDGNTLRVKRGALTFRSQTHEGVKACNEAISYLQSVRPASRVEYMRGLCSAARDIVEHMGPDGSRKPPSDMGAIIDRHGQYEGTLSQVIAFIYEDDVLATMQDLVVCDGDSSRHTAHLLLNPEYRFAGVSVGAQIKGQPRLLIMQFVTELWEDK